MKRRLKLFFLIHFFIIITSSTYLVIDSFIQFHYTTKAKIPVLSFLKHNIYEGKYVNDYMILSGLNTGYGFYGITVSTEKFLEIELYDSNRNIIKSDKYFDFNTNSGYSRFKGYASHLANYISDTKEMTDNDSTIESKNNIALREKYIDKVFKWMGKSIAHSSGNCYSYKVKLYSLVPINIWHQSEKQIPKLYAIKEIEYITK